MRFPDKLRYMTLDEAAETLDVPTATSGRLWRLMPRDKDIPPKGEWPEPDSPDRVATSLKRFWHRLPESDQQRIIAAANQSASNFDHRNYSREAKKRKRVALGYGRTYSALKKPKPKTRPRMVRNVVEAQEERARQKIFKKKGYMFANPHRRPTGYNEMPLYAGTRGRRSPKGDRRRSETTFAPPFSRYRKKARDPEVFVTFDSWSELLSHLQGRDVIYYHPPLNYRPVMVKVSVRGRRVRVTPYDREADPFWADSGHLSRFKRRIGRDPSRRSVRRARRA